MDAVAELKKEEEKLMEAWRERWQEKHSRYPCFNPDGIVDYERWGELPKGKHILVILKETNGLDGSLADFLRIGGSKTYYRTWNNVARWVKVILEDTCCDVISRAELNDAVRNIAAINLKKYAGGARANPKEVRREALLDADLLRAQIRLYCPDIILTGGWGLVSDFVHDVLFEEENPWDYQPEKDRNAESDPKLWYYRSDRIREGRKTLVVSMPHPNRASKKWMYELQKCCRHASCTS